MTTKHTTDAHDVMVIGVGNADRSDDAVGLWVARELDQRAGQELPDTVRILERSGEATSLMDAWQGARAVIVVDAVQSGARPGVVHRLDAASEPVPGSFLRCSTHSFGVADAIELGRALGQLPPRLIVYGIEGQEFGLGNELSVPVRRAMAEVLDLVRAEISSLLED